MNCSQHLLSLEESPDNRDANQVQPRRHRGYNTDNRFHQAEEESVILRIISVLQEVNIDRDEDKSGHHLTEQGGDKMLLYASQEASGYRMKDAEEEEG